MSKIILASQSKVRKEILDNNGIENQVEPSNVDEDVVKESLIKEKASPEIISKNLAELKANKVSQKNYNSLVLGADSVIDLDGELISKPKDRKEALQILKKLKWLRFDKFQDPEASASRKLTVSMLSGREIRKYGVRIDVHPN